MLYTKLVNLASETTLSPSAFEGMLKMVISSDTVTADQKYKDPFKFKPYAKHIFSMNELPKTRDKSHGYFRKILVLPFNIQIPREKQDQSLRHEKISPFLNELDGVFLWALEGLKRLRRRGYFIETELMKNAKGDYEEDVNPVLTFVKDHCEIASSETTYKSDLYKAYIRFCELKGHYYKETDKRFGKLLRQAFPAVKGDDSCRTSNARYWEGIKLIDEGLLQDNYIHIPKQEVMANSEKPEQSGADSLLEAE